MVESENWKRLAVKTHNNIANLGGGESIESETSNMQWSYFKRNKCIIRDSKEKRGKEDIMLQAELP